MSTPSVPQPDAETPLNDLTNGSQQAVYTVEAAGSETSSENEELAPANISERLDQIQNTMNQLVQAIATVNAKVTLNTNQIIQNSTDIIQIKQNTTLLAQLMTQLTKKFLRNDVNTQARIVNSHAKHPTDTLRPLLNMAFVNCQKFPTTLTELDELDDETVVDILQQLDLAIDGNARAKKNRLQDHIGVLTL